MVSLILIFFASLVIIFVVCAMIGHLFGLDNLFEEMENQRSPGANSDTINIVNDLSDGSQAPAN